MTLQKFRQPTVLVTENRNEMSPHQKREEKSSSQVRKLTINGHLKCTLTSLIFTAKVVQVVQANWLSKGRGIIKIFQKQRNNSIF